MPRGGWQEPGPTDHQVADHPAVGHRAVGCQAVIDAATRRYLAGTRVDMSEIAAELGIGRATLYRWVGNHDDLLAVVLSEQTERLFRRTTVDERLHGVDRVLAVLEAFMNAVLESESLQALTARDPVLFLRLATMPGAIEARSTELIAEVLECERAAGRMVLPLPVPVLAQAVVRVSDAFLYRHLLGAGPPDVASALSVVALLLRQDRQDPQDHQPLPG
jgi:AcrR family transcriptional regulator